MHTKIGIVAGNGALPACLIQTCQSRKQPFFVIALKGHTDAALLPPDTPVQWVRLGAVGTAIAAMKREHVTDIVLIGGVRRPSWREFMPDFRGWRFLVKLGFRPLGDDGLLRHVIREIESEGFRVRGVDSLIPELLAQPGVLGTVQPTSRDRADIQRGVDVALALGQADVGQAVIVQQGLVLSVEGIEGTKALIERTAALKRAGGGGVLVKVVKPNQERRADLPTIGPETVQSVYDAGLKGIAIESGGVLVVAADETVALANRLGIFIVGETVCRN